MWEFLCAIAPLFMMVYKEYLSREAKAKADNDAFTLDQTTLKKIVDKAVDDWNNSNQERSKEAASAWDKADDDAGGK